LLLTAAVDFSFQAVKGGALGGTARWAAGHDLDESGAQEACAGTREEQRNAETRGSHFIALAFRDALDKGRADEARAGRRSSVRRGIGLGRGPAVEPARLAFPDGWNPVITQMEQFAKREKVPVVLFEKGQRKDDVAAAYRKKFASRCDAFADRKKRGNLAITLAT
jgi:hypothetical protein